MREEKVSRSACILVHALHNEPLILHLNSSAHSCAIRVSELRVGTCVTVADGVYVWRPASWQHSNEDYIVLLSTQSFT